MRTRSVLQAVGLTLALAAPAAGGPSPCDGRQEETTEERVDRAFDTGRVMPLSSYDDDPFVEDTAVECLDAAAFERTPEGRPILASARVAVVDEDRIYRLDPATGRFNALAWNPWPLPLAGDDGSFRFPDENRFPPFRVLRGTDGKIVLRDGLQEWLPHDVHRGMNTVFEAAEAVRAAAEEWAGRPLPWGSNGLLEINAHAFIDFNAFYSPSARMLFFGVVPYRLPGETTAQMFEVASSWEVAAHEAGHAVQHVLKPNYLGSDFGARTWGESFGDQTAMWTALRDPGRVRALLAATGGELASSNALTVLAEALGALIGHGGGLRDAFNDETVSTTANEIHDRSRVLTGAAYRLFAAVFEQKARIWPDERALRDAGAVLGSFLVHGADHLPENAFTLEDVGKAHLTVDRELFDGRWHRLLVNEFTRREIFDAGSVAEWLAHRAALPAVRLDGWLRADDMVQASVDALGIGPDFGLAVQSVTRDEREQRTIVRVTLTYGRGADAVPLDNHGILVFRPNGTLADWHPPLAPEVLAGGEAVAALDGARALGLDGHGAPLAIARDAEGRLGAEARVLRGDGMEVWMEAFTLAAPEGERREVVGRSWGGEERAEAVVAAALE